MAKAVKKTAKNAKKEVAGKEFVSGTGRKFVKSSAGVEFWNPEKEGDTIEGEFIERMEFKGGKYSKLKDSKGNPISIKPVVLTEDGKQIAMPETASMVKFFEGVEIGEHVHIVYGGLKTKKGQEGKKKPEQFHAYEFAKELV